MTMGYGSVFGRFWRWSSVQYVDGAGMGHAEARFDASGDEPEGRGAAEPVP